jgi:hypothetical protein
MAIWSSIANNEIVTDSDLNEAVVAGIFVSKTTIPQTNKGLTKARAISYVYLNTSNATYSPKANNQLVAKRDLTAPTPTLTPQGVNTCVSCTDYPVSRDTNTDSPTYNHYYVNGFSVGTTFPAGACNYSPNYVIEVGTRCIDCVNYSVFQNNNPCFTGDQYVLNGATYATNPSTGGCDYNANYSIIDGTLCSGCTNYVVYRNSNSCFTGNQYFANGVTYTANPHTGSCVTTASYTNNVGSYCNGCTTHVVYQNTNPCFTGNQFFTNGISYATNPSTGACNTSAAYDTFVGNRCVSCTNRAVYQNNNPCFTGNQFYTPYNNQTWATNPTTPDCEFTANYNIPVGSRCIGCVTYTVFQNSNSCFSGDQYIVNGTTYAFNPSTGSCSPDPNYNSVVGYICISCTTYTVYANTNSCFSGNQYYTSYNGGTTYSSNPSTTSCLSTPNIQNTGVQTCSGCTTYFIFRDQNPCSSTFNDYYVNGINVGSSVPPTGACSTGQNLVYQGYNTCVSCISYGVFRDENSCSSTYNNYFVNGSNVGAAAPSSAPCNCCEEISVSNNSGSTAFIQWLPCTASGNTSYFLANGSTIYFCRNTSASFNTSGLGYSVIGSCSYNGYTVV